MSDKIGALIVDVKTTELTPEEREILAHPLIGGVTLFTRNYDNRTQLKQLCESIRQSSKTPLLILVDQEGGRVQRFIEEFTRLPAMGALGEMYDTQPEKATQSAQHYGKLMAHEILTSGIDLSLAPVLDLNRGLNTVIGARAFHADPAVVTTLATALIEGMQAAGMAAVGKHFPGHGGVLEDSHLALPTDTRTFAEIANSDLLPFAALVKKGISAMMAAHIVFPAIDALPVSYSRRWLQDILRSQLKFQGTIFSDDLTMEGANISENYADRVKAAREAGCDFALLCNHPEGVIQAIDQLPLHAHWVSKEKWGGLQGNAKINLN